MADILVAAASAETEWPISTDNVTAAATARHALLALHGDALYTQKFGWWVIIGHTYFTAKPNFVLSYRLAGVELRLLFG